MNKYKPLHDHNLKDHLDNRSSEEKHIDILLNIANELAERNRLKSLELEMKFRTFANRTLYRSYKGKDGETFTVPPDAKQKEEWKEEIKAITKELKDHAVAIDDQQGEKTSG